MIGFAVVAVRRFVGPREVLHAAPARLRVQFWVLVGSGVSIATVTVSARGDVVQQTNWIAYWPMTVWVVSTLVGTGYLIAKLDTLRESLIKTNGRIDALESATVRTDKLDDKLELVTQKIDALHELLKRTDREWRDSLHGSKE